MLFFKKKDDPIAEFKKYNVTIIFNGEEDLSYQFTNVLADNADDAVDQMKQYVAKNGFFGEMDYETVMSKLSAADVEEI